MGDEIWQRTMDRWCRTQWQILAVHGFLYIAIGGGGLIFLYATSRNDMREIIDRLDSIKYCESKVEHNQTVTVERLRTVEDNARDILKKQGKVD